MKVVQGRILHYEDIAVKKEGCTRKHHEEEGSTVEEKHVELHSTGIYDRTGRGI